MPHVIGSRLAVEPVNRPPAQALLDEIRESIHRLIAHSCDIEGFTEGSDLLMQLEQLAPYVAPIPLSRIADRVEDAIDRLSRMADLYPHGTLKESLMLRVDQLIRLQGELRGGLEPRLASRPAILSPPIAAEASTDA